MTTKLEEAMAKAFERNQGERFWDLLGFESLDAYVEKNWRTSLPTVQVIICLYEELKGTCK